MGKKKAFHKQLKIKLDKVQFSMKKKTVIKFKKDLKLVLLIQITKWLPSENFQKQSITSMGLNLIKFNRNLKPFSKIILILINLTKIIKRKLLAKKKLISLLGSRKNLNKLIKGKISREGILNQVLRQSQKTLLIAICLLICMIL